MKTKQHRGCSDLLPRHQPARKKRGGFFIALSAVIAALGALLAALWNLLKELFSWPF